jgi:hypothetical protein
MEARGTDAHVTKNDLIDPAHLVPMLRRVGASHKLLENRHHWLC